ncbi:MAG: lipid II:glycine glycyltransferase FemX [Erythrobacter sp.]
MARGATLHKNLEVQPLDEASARALLEDTPWASWRQMPAYSKVAASDQGAESRYLQVVSENQRVALANVRVKRMPVLSVGVAMIAQGPVMLAEEGVDRAAVCTELARHVGGTMGLTLRINPPLQVGIDPAPLQSPFASIPGSQYETFAIDLAPDLDQLRKTLNGKWRTDLRRGERSGVTITRSSAEEDFLAFQPLLEQLAAGKGFDVPQDARFFAEVAQLAQEPERIVIHLAHHEGRVIGGHVGAFSGDTAVYLIGATNDEGRDLRASFLLQWAVIEHAKSLGLRWYDLGGADEVGNPYVFRFKKRMGGHHHIGPPMIEAAAPWPRGAIARLAETVYKRIRR